MTQPPLTSPKPISEVIRPEITSLPELTWSRRLARRLWKIAARILVWLVSDVKVSGLEHIPRQGAALIVMNHLGDADFIVGVAVGPRLPDLIAKAELYDIPVLGRLLRAYGAIWVHRGQPDRRAIRAALEALAEGRLLGIAPEGRESLTGALEEGTEGAAFLAIKADVPVIPVTYTGTENSHLLGNLKRLRRTPITLTVGAPFRLPSHPERKIALQIGTQAIMQSLARQLPPEYRGVYSEDVEGAYGSR